MKRLLVFGAALCLIGLLRVPAGADEITSQRKWMQQNGQTDEGPGRWEWRITGPAPLLGPNGWPIRPDNTEADPKSPDTCVGCHYWVENKTITEEGFTNILGETPEVTNLDVSPKKLLDDAIHTDANGNKTYDSKHAENYDKEGCFACHKQHGPVANFGCGKCHVADPDNGFATFHATHPVLVEAEQPLGDPANFTAGKPSCGYCHPTLPVIGNVDIGKAACWNCHMSGHRPVKLDSEGGGVAYWKSIPSTPTVP